MWILIAYFIYEDNRLPELSFGQVSTTVAFTPSVEGIRIGNQEAAVV